jgi:hypothetical protein
MIWDLNTVREVKQLYVSARVDEHFLQQGKYAVDVMAKKAFRRLQEMSAHLGVTLYPEDIAALKLDRPSADFRTEYHFAWRPVRQAAELHGGAADGSVHAVETIDLDDITLEAPAEEPSWNPASEPHILTFAVKPITYTYAGWNDSTRNWVYRLRE